MSEINLKGDYDKMLVKFFCSLNKHDCSAPTAIDALFNLNFE